MWCPFKVFFVFCFNYNKYSHTIQHPSDLARRKNKNPRKTMFSAADMPSRSEGGGPAGKNKTDGVGWERRGGQDEAFTFWVAGKRRRWGLGRRDWCPWTWRSSGGPRGSCCWCRLCRRCWAWRPLLRLSSASDLLSPGPSAGSDLKTDIKKVSPNTW